MLTKQLSDEQYRRALESWRWLDLGVVRPVLVSLFGDVIFESRDDGYWFLDTMEGTYTREWSDRDELHSALDSEEGQDQYLLGALAMAADRNGLVLGPDEVYAFVPPPVLGGGFEVENITRMDFVVAVHLAGQLHQQLQALPPGIPITELRFEPGPPPGR